MHARTVNTNKMNVAQLLVRSYLSNDIALNHFQKNFKFNHRTNTAKVTKYIRTQPSTYSNE
jgi:hypothetical protein